MTDGRNAAQEGLRAALLELEDLRGRLLELAEGLAPVEEAGLLEEESPDEAAKPGVIVQCVILDRLDPAIRDLAEAVAAIGDEG